MSTANFLHTILVITIVSVAIDLFTVLHTLHFDSTYNLVGKDADIDHKKWKTAIHYISPSEIWYALT